MMAAMMSGDEEEKQAADEEEKQAAAEPEPGEFCVRNRPCRSGCLDSEYDA